MRPDRRAEMDFRIDIVRFLMANPGLRRKPYGDRFVDAVTEVFHSIVYNTYLECVKEGVESVDNPRFREIMDRVEERYPTWEQISSTMLSGETVKLPNGYEI